MHISSNRVPKHNCVHWHQSRAAMKAVEAMKAMKPVTLAPMRCMCAVHKFLIPYNTEMNRNAGTLTNVAYTSSMCRTKMTSQWAQRGCGCAAPGCQGWPCRVPLAIRSQQAVASRTTPRRATRNAPSCTGFVVCCHFKRLRWCWLERVEMSQPTLRMAISNALVLLKRSPTKPGSNLCHMSISM